jgi:hypothetical protein
LRASFNSGTSSAKMPGGMLAFAPALTRAEDVGDNVLSFIGREREHRHSRVRGRRSISAMSTGVKLGQSAKIRAAQASDAA